MFFKYQTEALATFHVSQSGSQALPEILVRHLTD